MLNKKYMVILSIALVLALLVGCGNEEQGNMLEKVEAKGKLVVGTSADYPPYEFHTLIDGEDKIVGFDISLAQYIADELGVELEIQDMDFKNLVGALPAEMVDIVIAGMTPDPERDINFSDVYYNATHGVVVRKDKMDLIKTEKDLEGKKLGVQMGSVQEDIAEQIKDAELVSLSLTNNLLMELKTDRVDGIIMEKPVAEAYAKANDDLMVVESINIVDGEGGSAIGIKKGEDEFTNRINEILKDVKDKELLDQWFIDASKMADEAGVN